MMTKTEFLWFCLSGCCRIRIFSRGLAYRKVFLLTIYYDALKSFFQGCMQIFKYVVTYRMITCDFWFVGV